MLGNIARVLVVTAMCAAAVGSASSTSSQPSTLGSAPPPGPNGTLAGPPAPRAMEPDRSLGVWKSTFGAVKIEPDQARGGIGAGAIQGVWVYQRRGDEVIGYFSGTLRGNVLQFTWQEPSTTGNPPLVGSGYLEFDPSGRQYTGKWWTDARDRQGDWNGWRQNAGPQQPEPGYQPQPQPQPYGGQGYGGYNGGPYGGQPYGGGYGPQPHPYDGQPQPYQPQPQRQQQPYQPQQPRYPQQPQQPRYPQPQQDPYGPAQPAPAPQPRYY